MHDSRLDPDRPPEVPQTFADDPRPVAAEGGCGRASLIGCGVLVVLVGIVFVLVAFNVEAVLVRLLRLQQTAMERSLPADLPAAERERVDQAWSGLYRAIDEGEVEPEAIQRLQRELMETTPGPDRRLSREQVRRLTEALEATAAGEMPPEAPSPEVVEPAAEEPRGDPEPTVPTQEVP